MQCVSTTSFSIAINGDLYGFFPGKSGVRQGDPLFPYLFICCMEYLSRMLILACRQPGFRFHPKCGIHDISHLAFTNDVLLLSHGDCSSVNGIFQQLTIFGKTAGLDINPKKSSIFFRGVSPRLKLSILHTTGFREGCFPFTYLGVSRSPHRLLTSQFSPLLHSLQFSVQGWIGKHLTFDRRLDVNPEKIKVGLN